MAKKKKITGKVVVVLTQTEAGFRFRVASGAEYFLSTLYTRKTSVIRGAQRKYPHVKIVDQTPSAA